MKLLFPSREFNRTMLSSVSGGWKYLVAEQGELPHVSSEKIP